MMDDLISRQAAIETLWKERHQLDDYMDECLKKGLTALRAGTKAERNRIEEDIEIIREQPTVDAVQVVRCGECKYRKVNEHYGEKGYMKLKAICTLDTGDPFELGRNAEDDDWFCADGERRDPDA